MCKICNKKISIKGLGAHLKHKHNITKEEYYIKYYKKENEGFCIECNKNTSLISIVKGYHKFCSCKCSNNNKDKIIKELETKSNKSPEDKELWNKRKRETTLKNFGVTHNSKSDVIKKQKKKTKFKNHGDENYNNSKKSVETMLNNVDEEGLNGIERKNKKIKEAHRSFSDTKKKVIQSDREETNMKKYNASNIMMLDSIKTKLKEIMFNKYGVSSNFERDDFKKFMKKNLKEILQKQRKTHEDNNNWTPNELLDEYDYYLRQVSKYTERAFKEYYNQLTDNGKKKRGRYDYHLDHKYSKQRGFLDNITPNIIGSIYNLELLLCKDNLKKSSKCSITKEKLIEEFENGVQ